MKSVMLHDFSRVPQSAIPRSCFDRSHGLKTAFDSGYLVPIELQEVLPGDEVRFDANIFARLAPAVTPVMDNVFLDLQAFFCPSRILWNNFTKMMGERVNPDDSIDYLVPQLTASNATGFKVGSLADYFGIPVGIKSLKVNQLPFRMYAKVWDDWYRDENLQDSIISNSSVLGDGQDNHNFWNVLRKRGKRHDYFTSSLPWSQRGAGVELPLGTQAPVRYGDSPDPNTWSGGGHLDNVLAGKKVFAGSDDIGTESNPKLISQFGVSYENDFVPINNSVVDGVGAANPLYADLSTATAATINSLRMAFQLQRLLELDARSGTRYVELIRSHFRTICPDARLQRSEYLGGSSQLISFDEVAQTAATSNGLTPQGNLVANGRVFTNLRFRKAFTEHGYIMILASVRCDLNYQQGLDRMWSRRGRYDFFWPVLQNLGEQAVLNKEIFAQGPGVKDDDDNVIDEKVFGYQERYAEYRYNPSKITGKMRSGVDGSLDVWHLAQYFSELPTLSAEFIEDAPPLSRVLSVQDEPQIICDCYLKQKWCRPMYTYSIPGLIDHL